jgi:hypothetical protein
MTQGLRVGVGAAVGGAPGAAIAAVPVNRAIEALSRSVFDTKAGRAMMLSATSLDDLRPLVTGGVVSAPTEQAVQQPTEVPTQFSMPPELGGEPSEVSKYEMPPELLTPTPPEPTTTIDKQRQAIFNTELKSLMGQSIAAQEQGNEEKTGRATRDLTALLMEAMRNKIPLSY